MKTYDEGVTRHVETVDLALMQQAMAHAVEGASRIDVDGCYTYVNDRYAEIAGRKPEEMLGQPWAETSVAGAIAALATDFSPLSDVRASAGYRLQVAGNLLRRALLASGSGQGNPQLMVTDYA